MFKGDSLRTKEIFNKGGNTFCDRFRCHCKHQLFRADQRSQDAAGDGGDGGISQFVQSNPASFINALNLLGWTLFFGMACLVASMAMGKDRKERIIKYALLSDGIMMLCSQCGLHIWIKHCAGALYVRWPGGGYNGCINCPGPLF